MLFYRLQERYRFEMRTIQEAYQNAIDSGKLHADPAQLGVLPELERIRAGLLPPKRKKSWFLKAPKAVKGLYLWGGVGRGKSMLMDLVYDEINVPKQRAHFHGFMQWVHSEIAKARDAGVSDPIAPVAEALASDVQFLAFDEMQITDITDAMLVGRLFEKLFVAGVTVITTSNRVPDDLYKDGLNRQLFLPFIALLKERMVIHELKSDTDYRQGRLEGTQVYFSPVNADARAKISSIWDDMTGGEADALTLQIKGREVVIPAFRNGAGRASFYDLCAKPLGPADYLAIADAVRVLVLEDIPNLSRSNYNEARRFVTLIDALYEAKVRLICSAAASPEMLYVEGSGSFEFERTASRLREMQSEDWTR